ncbi:MAG: hypothetical protein MI750_14800 [Xanthomonadales bacterium]|nr:hypothetical protein [Xanthomonadales bacterium]
MKQTLKTLTIDDLEERLAFSLCSGDTNTGDGDDEKTPPNTGGDHAQITDSKQTDPDV